MTKVFIRNFTFLVFFICLFNSFAFAKPKIQTPVGKFKPYTGTWKIISPNTSPLFGCSFELLYKHDDILEVNTFVNSEGRFIGLLTGRPGRLDAKKRKFKTRFSILDTEIRKSLGIGGDLFAEVPKRNKFNQLNLQFVSDDDSLASENVVAERVKDLEGDARKIVFRLVKKGALRPGKILTLNIKAINLGRSLIQKGDVNLSFDFSGPVESIEIKRLARISDCEIQNQKLMICSANYLGPKRNTVATAELELKIDSNARVGDSIVVVLDATSDRDLGLNTKIIGASYQVKK